MLGHETLHRIRRWLDPKPEPATGRCSRLQFEQLEARVVPTMILPLANRTGLSASQASVYVLGYSVASNLWLDASGHFVDSRAMTELPAHNLADLSAITIHTGQAVIGARVAFFVTGFNEPPRPYRRLPDGGVVQPINPPNSDYPPFDIVELTNTAADSFIINSQTVDGFIFPLTLTLNNGAQVGTTLPAGVGAPVVTRQAIFPAYQAFMNDPQLGGAGAPYLDLLFRPGRVAGQYGGIVNPGRFLDPANGNSASPLNTVFDSTLTRLFTDPSLNLSIIGDDNNIYAGVPLTDAEGRQFLEFSGGGNTYRVYNPMTPNPQRPLPTGATSGYVVFANDGAFADDTANAIVSGPVHVGKGIQRDLVAALNRGIATRGPASGAPGYTSRFWGTQANWYPAGATMNLFSLFMHTGQMGGQSIFVDGAAYGFAYDENPAHGPAGQPLVPSKFDPVPAGTTSVTITLGPWFDAATIAVYRPSNRSFYLDLNGNGRWDGPGTDRTFVFGIAGDVPVSGDWSGSGTTKIGVYRPRNRTFYLDFNGNGTWEGPAIDRQYIFGTEGDTPITGDWDGDGKFEIGIYRSSNRRFYLDRSGNGRWDGPGTDTLYAFGSDGDTPISGDWNGDGKTEVGIYRSSNRTFYLDLNGNGQWDGPTIDGQHIFGTSGDVPVVGNWTGGRNTLLGIFRPSSRKFYLDASGNHQWDSAISDAVFAFGISSDRPLAGHWA